MSYPHKYTQKTNSCPHSYPQYYATYPHQFVRHSKTNYSNIHVTQTKYQTYIPFYMPFSHLPTYIYPLLPRQKRHTDTKVIHNQTHKTCALSTTQPVKTIQHTQNHAKITFHRLQSYTHLYSNIAQNKTTIQFYYFSFGLF